MNAIIGTEEKVPVQGCEREGGCASTTRIDVFDQDGSGLGTITFPELDTIDAAVGGTIEGCADTN